MKFSGTFSFLWCLLIALGLLFSGLCCLATGKAPRQFMPVDEEIVEIFEEKCIAEEGGESFVLFVCGEYCLRQCFDFCCFMNFSVDQRPLVNPSGWIMPFRI